MFKFEGKKKRKDFKSEDSYLNYIYRQNKARIDEAFDIQDSAGNLKSAKKQFKYMVTSEKIMQGSNIRAALKSVARKNIFTPPEQRLHDNVYTTLKNYKAFGQFRNLTKNAKGQFAKYDPSLLKWDKDEHQYVYNGIVAIRFDNSPQMLILVDLRTNTSYTF